jgi:hypothetical protein
LYLKDPRPGIGVFLRIILLVITLCGRSVVIFLDSSLDKILTAPNFIMEAHSSASEESKPNLSSGVACFMLNSEFLVLAGPAMRQRLA